MEKINVLILVLSVVTAHAAVIQNKDVIHKRVERSPYERCDDDDHDHHGPPFPPGPPGPQFMGPPPLPPPGFFRAKQWRHGHHHGVYGGPSAAGVSQAGGSAEGFGGGQQQSASFSNSQHQSAKFGSAGKHSGNFRNTQQNAEGFESSGQSASQSESGNGDGSSGAGYYKSRDALKGGLNLANQGSDASGQSGCSSCGKSGYSISNAKSNSGDAVAVSVNG